MITISKEEHADRDAIHQLNLAAFEDGLEARIVDKLRLFYNEFLSFVALKHEKIVGYIKYSINIINMSENTRHIFNCLHR